MNKWLKSYQMKTTHQELSAYSQAVTLNISFSVTWPEIFLTNRLSEAEQTNKIKVEYQTTIIKSQKSAQLPMVVEGK